MMCSNFSNFVSPTITTVSIDTYRQRFKPTDEKKSEFEFEDAVDADEDQADIPAKTSDTTVDDDGFVFLPT